MKIFEYSKTIAGLVGAVITAVLGLLPSEQYQWLVVAGVIATTISVYLTPNQAIEPQNRGRRVAGQPSDPQG
ncbi:hypothetical protein ODZ83_11030 [Acaricomes phytoseiuli]|uniref:hypothetical protein n=1 Tax=Acaricomes phytoseiuli TaxID=291968 RepID=UPI000369DE9C|nr:hypothetical protein [Acaricomes phytoseiuli]MCW1250695.1 hypothetical protein [Acaricomes phytoseiuli]